MQLGVVFPQTEIGADPGAVRALAQTAEGLGYSYLLAYEHVLGADPRYHPGWGEVYALKDMFHEPFALFSYLAAVTQRIRLLTGVIILPQRQTVLVAKQAAEVDVLSHGRLLLGIGIGWNRVEYEALGEDFHNRGVRSEEQVAVLRALWTQESVDFQGRWHRIRGAGLNPLPRQRPIPIWFGGGAEPVIKRAARLGDGWLAIGRPDPQRAAAVKRLREYAQEAGRDPDSIAIGASVHLRQGSVESLIEDATGWKSIGATHLAINTMGAGLTSVAQHLQALASFREAVKDLP